MSCDCINLMNAALPEGTEVDVVMFMDKRAPRQRVATNVTKNGKAKTGKQFIIAAFCPTCGKKYES
jgi:hypothetical protein